jgi:hypothetical protein
MCTGARVLEPRTRASDNPQATQLFQSLLRRKGGTMNISQQATTLIGTNVPIWNKGAAAPVVLRGAWWKST